MNDILDRPSFTARMVQINRYQEQQLRQSNDSDRDSGSAATPQAIRIRIGAMTGSQGDHVITATRGEAARLEAAKFGER